MVAVRTCSVTREGFTLYSAVQYDCDQTPDKLLSCRSFVHAWRTERPVRADCCKDLHLKTQIGGIPFDENAELLQKHI